MCGACGTFGESIITCALFMGNMKETDHLEVIDRDGRITLKWILRRTRWRGLDSCSGGKAPSDRLICAW